MVICGVGECTLVVIEQGLPFPVRSEFGMLH